MGLGTAFDALSQIVDHYESHGGSITQVTAMPADPNGDKLSVAIDVPISTFLGSEGRQGLTPMGASITDDGNVHIEYELTSLDEPPTLEGATFSSVDTTVDVEDDEVRLRVECLVEPGDQPVAASAASPSNERDETTSTGGEPSAEGDGWAEAGEDDGRIGTLEDEGRNRSAGEPAANEVDSTVETDGGDADPSTETRDVIDDTLAATRDESVPPYEDTDYLQRLYELCDSFTQMSRRIDMDVSSETVRRYMIQADIHEPNTYDTSSGSTSSENEGPEQPSAETPDQSSEETPEQPSAGTAEEPSEKPTDRSSATQRDAPFTADETLDDRSLADHVDLPDGLEMEDVVDAVIESMTVHEATRRLDLDRKQTRDLLADLDLLDLVSRPLSKAPEEPINYETVAGRINRCRANEA
ncbi:prolipoprotein diacylglyceryl transferase [Halorubrum vacuolatum]|nr:hypothetical protein [Halorubrum vacuolatum]